MIYLYGLIDGDIAGLRQALNGMQGLESELEITQIGEWGLVHSAHASAEIEPRRRLMLIHTRVQEAMMPFGTVLPARFGLIARDLDEVRPLITARAPVIASEFSRVAGCVELGLRVSFDRATALAATMVEDTELSRERERLSRMGREAHFAMAEFGGKLADRLDRRRGHAQAALIKAILPLIRSHVLRRPDEDTEVLRAEVLLSEPDQASFLQAVEVATRALTFAPGAEPMITLVGPVPPYNFVRLSLALESEEQAA